MMKLLSVLFIAILFIQIFVGVSSIGDAVNSVPQEDMKRNARGRPYKINCRFPCARRCSKASRQHFCFRACSSCCAACGCVPPGTYGNKNICPCYAKLKTHGNRPKCP